MTLLYSVTGEDNDLVHPDSGFSSVHVMGGTVEVSEAAALVGSYGFALTFLAGYKLYVKRWAERTARYRAAFYLDQNTFAIPDGSYQTLFRNFDWRAAFQLRWHRSGSTYQLQGVYLLVTGQSNGNFITFPSGSHLVELDWKGSSSEGANDGFLRMWIDSSQQTMNLESKDNHLARACSVGFGSNSNAVTGVSGTLYVDHFRANNDGSVIGA